MTYSSKKVFVGNYHVRFDLYTMSEIQRYNLFSLLGKYINVFSLQVFLFSYLRGVSWHTKNTHSIIPSLK